MARALIKFADDVVVPFESGAVPELPDDLQQLWQDVTGQFDFLSLNPLADGVAEDDLRRMVSEAAGQAEGEPVPDPTLCFGIDVPQDAAPDPDTVAGALVAALDGLPFVEFAEAEQDLVAAVNRAANPAALFQTYLNPAPVGLDTDAAWALAGGDGSGVTVGVLEAFDFDRAHRDAPVNRFELTPAVAVSGDIDADHATAVVGILAAADNTEDIVGIVPEARIVFASGTVPSGIPTLPTGTAFSLINLIGVQVSAGDVLNLSLQIPGPLPSGGTALLPVEASGIVRTALRLAAFRGVTCVIAAGNTGIDFDTEGVSFPDSGAVVVGGVVRDAPPVPVSFHVSAHSNTGARIDCCAWAGDVTTLTTVATTFQTIPEDQGGTSLATPMVSGVVASVQGRVKALGRPPLTPAQIRALLRDPASGTDVCPGQGVGLMPDLSRIMSKI